MAIGWKLNKWGELVDHGHDWGNHTRTKLPTKSGVGIIPEGTTEIGYRAFEDCTGLTNINIPNSVTEIGRCAFEGCTGLTSINIPDSVKWIVKSTFEGCTGLTCITTPEKNVQRIKSILKDKHLKSLVVGLPDK